MEHEEIWDDIRELKQTTMRQAARIERLDRDRIAHIGHITKLGTRIEQLVEDIAELAKAIVRINERFPSTAVAVVRLDDYMAEFFRDAATDATPDPLDTGIVERPL